MYFSSNIFNLSEQSLEVVKENIRLSETMKKPLSVLQKAVNKQVSIRLKNDHEYKGKMMNIDQYMNVILTNAEEYNNNSLSANYGKLVIRGNNVLFIKIESDL
jgi:small nuclear ribonucleoprotein|tara:strand:- start:718 stop:1026 length:309 start_codon:yes stop_codon:yes gene_type:complete